MYALLLKMNGELENENGFFTILKYYQRFLPDDKILSVAIFKAFNYWLKLDDDDYIESKNLAKDFGIFQTLYFDALDTVEKPETVISSGLDKIMNSVLHAKICNILKVQEKYGPEVTAKIIDDLSIAMAASGVECYWIDNSIYPKLDEYLEIVQLKNVLLLKGVFEIIQEKSAKKTNYIRILELFLLFSQIHADYINIYNDDLYKKVNGGVPRYFGYPFLHAINQNGYDSEIKEILEMKFEKIKAKDHFLSILDMCGSVDATKAKLVEIRQELFEKIEEVGGNPLMVKLIDAKMF